MPFVKVNKSSAWSLWQQGLITGINAGLGDEPQQLTVNLGVNKGFNALRLFLTDAANGFALVPGDYLDIGASYAGAPNSGTSGWNQTTLTRTGTYYNEPEGSKTVAEVAARITAILDNCAAVGMGVVLTVDCWATSGNRMWANVAADVDSDPDNFSGETLSGSPSATTATAVQQGLIDFWRATAAKWGSHPAVIGYDILNEPDPAVQADWPALALRMVNAIRVLDTATPIVVEGAKFGTAPGLAAFGPSHALVTGWATNKIVFSFHAYQPIGSTHGGLAEWAYEQMGSPYPVTGAVYDYETGDLLPILTAQDLIDTYYAPAVTFKQTYGVPIFVGEFSYVDQSGIDFGSESGLFYQPAESSYSRQVTSVDVASGQLTLVMGNIERRTFADRTGLGFRVDASDQMPATVDDLQNTVRVSLVARYPDPVEVDPDPATAAANAEILAALSQEEQALNEQVWDLIRALQALETYPPEVTVTRGDHRYVITMDTTGLTAIASGDPVMSGGSVLSYPPVALVSLAPTVDHLAAMPESRLTYARHVLNMCQSHGFSWSWHSVSSEYGRHWWAASPEIYALLRDAAMGRTLSITA